MKEMREKTLALAEALDPSKLRKKLIPIDSRLIEQAVREGVAGILYKSLLASGHFESLDHVHKETLQTFYYGTIRMNLRLLHALKQVLFHANQRGLAVVVLQGMDLLNDPYEDIGHRPMTDIDLFISRENREGIIQVLGTQGYERDAIYPGTFKQGAILFDLHTHILWADRIRARKLLLGRNEKPLMRDLREIEIEGEKALCLSPCDQVLYLSLHAFKHRVARLIWLVDIKRILERWKVDDWERLVQRAEDLRQQRTLMYILFLLDRVFHFRGPRGALQGLQKRRLSPLEKKILRERVRAGALPAWGPVFLFSSGFGFLNRLRFLFENLFPSPEVLKQVFPSPPGLRPWQLYCKRALQLFGMLRKA